MTVVRAMVEADVRAVAGLRVAGWRWAYAGIVPQPYLDAMDVEVDAAERREMLVRGAGRAHNLVAEDAVGEVVGWAAFGPYRGEPAGGPLAELYTLYVLPARVGTGVGRALTAEVLRRAAALGCSRLALWVVAENARARRFYAAAGFAPDGTAAVELYGGAPVTEVRYVRDLPPAPLI
ncbi:GNAT family N-acetyltransferase [Actinacidiphila yeochonensis]|uniref:GNAT family N-acetyltransferase n=1 Tax=Actinacidiphila yeochonensis TaxID=89050 RepID=UPI001E2E36F1|nr:GNAT family N-acetyltransferase [Actinacidiphila yeochonensis]